LPEGLTVRGSLWLGDCTSLTSLPEGLKIEGDLYLDDCTSLISLPEGLEVQGNLNLDGCTGLQHYKKKRKWREGIEGETIW
jgi:hypothetical protein